MSIRFPLHRAHDHVNVGCSHCTKQTALGSVARPKVGGQPGPRSRMVGADLSEEDVVEHAANSPRSGVGARRACWEGARECGTSAQRYLPQRTGDH